MKHNQEREESAGQMAGQVSSSQDGGSQLTSEQACSPKVPNDNVGCGRVGGPEVPSVPAGAPQLSSTPAPKPQSRSRLKRFAQVGFLVAGMAILLVPALTTPLTLSEASAEKRELAPVPSLIEDGHFNNQVLAQAGAWFEDHFGFRNQIIGANALLMKDLFHESASDRVIMGKDNWLYYEGTLPDYMGTNRYTERQVYAAAHNIWLMQQYVEKRGGRLVVMLAPNKNSLYPEHMPDRYVRSTELHNMQRVEARLIKQGTIFVGAWQSFKPYVDPTESREMGPSNPYNMEVPRMATGLSFDEYLAQRADQGIFFESTADGGKLNEPYDNKTAPESQDNKDKESKDSGDAGVSSENRTGEEAAHPKEGAAESSTNSGSRPADDFARFIGLSRNIPTYNKRVKYLAQDTHWNDEGAYMAARDLLLWANVGDLRITGAEQGSQVGDLENMLFPAFAQPEKCMRLKTQVNPINLRLKNLPGIALPLYAMADLDTAWDRSEISGPVDAPLVTTTGQGSKRLYAYRDSFANALIPMLAPAFSEAEFSKAIPYDLTVLDKFKPDVVLIERAERHLDLLIEQPAIMPAPRTFSSNNLVEDEQGRTLKLNAQESGEFVLISGEVPADALRDWSSIRFASKLNGEDLRLDTFWLPTKDIPGAFALRVPANIWPELRASASVVVEGGNQDKQFKVIFE